MITKLTKIKLLVIEDSLYQATLLSDILIANGYSNFIILQSGKEAIDIIDDFQPDIILMDIILSDEMTGIEAIIKIKERHDIPFVYLTGITDNKILLEAKETMPYGFIFKPYKEYQLINTLEIILKQYITKKKERLLTNILQLLSSTSKKYNVLKDIFDLINAYVNADSAGIRLKAKNEFPFIVTKGFEKDFEKNQNRINKVCANINNQVFCFCNAVISKQKNISVNNFTEYGSFWTNDLKQLTSIIDKDYKENLFNNCLKYKYNSIAIIPLISKQGIIGTLQFHHRAKDFFDKDTIEYLEYLAETISIVLEEYELNRKIIETNKKFSLFINFFTDAVFIWNSKFYLEEYNQSANWLFPPQYRERKVVGEQITTLLPNITKSNLIYKLKKVISTGKSIIEEFKFEGKNEDKILMIRAFNMFDKLGMVITDITEQEKIRKKLDKLEKIEALGIVAGGIAHNFNNTMTEISSNISLLEHFFYNNKRIKRTTISSILNDVKKGINKGKKISKKLLTFSEGGRGNFVIFNATDKIKEIIDEFSQKYKNINFKYLSIENKYFIREDEELFSEMIKNLIQNSCEAIGERHGTISILMENFRDADSKNKKKYRNLRIIITNNGPPIKKKDINKIFDPFFTTKNGHTGLGLSIALSIAKKMNGRINLNSFSVKGTQFEIIIRYIDEYIATSYKKPLLTHINKQIKKQQKDKRVLLLEDEIALHRPARRIFKILGFNMTATIKGEDTIKEYKNAIKQAHPFDFVVLDLKIENGMDGVETIKELKKINPQIKAIVSSGYYINSIMADYKSYGFIASVPKPYSLSKFKQAVDIIMQS